MEQNVSSHSVLIEARKKASITSVVEVLSATDKTVAIKLKEKNMNIVGSNLRVEKLNLDEGLLIVVGDIDMVKYDSSDGGKSFIKRLFK